MGLKKALTPSVRKKSSKGRKPKTISNRVGDGKVHGRVLLVGGLVEKSVTDDQSGVIFGSGIIEDGVGRDW